MMKNNFNKEYSNMFDIPTTKTVKLSDAERFQIGFKELFDLITPKSIDTVGNKYRHETYVDCFRFDDGSILNLIDLINQSKYFYILK